MKIRTRATLLGILPALLVAALLSIYLSTSRLVDLEAGLHARGEALARHLAQSTLYGLVSGNQAVVEGMLLQMLTEPDLVYAAIYRHNGHVLAERGLLPAGQATTLSAGEMDSGDHLSLTVPIELPEVDLTDPFLADSQWVDPAGAMLQRVGWARVVVSRDAHDQAARQMLYASIGFTLLGLAFAWLLVRRLALTGVRPLMETIGTVREIASGNLDARLPVTARSELRILQEDINSMTTALRSLRQDMRAQVAAATAELAAQKEAAEQANQAKSRFLAAASHDLRQPLHAIGLYVEALKPQLVGRTAAEMLNSIDASVVSLEGLFNAILDVTRLDAGAVVPQLARVELELLLDRLWHEFRVEAEQSGFRLRTRCAPGLTCISDPLLLERILRNLLANALHFTQAGGVLLSARRHGNNALRIQVWDTGTGIPPEECERVFEEFHQVDNPQRDRSCGMGLGLSIVKRLADLLGYRLSLRSAPGRGSVFSLELPAISHENGIDNSPTEASISRYERLSGRVCVVEDDAESREALVMLLRGWGLEVASGAGSVEVLARFSQAPDVLLTDYHLSGESGLDVVRALRAAFPGQTFASVVITADTNETTTRELSDLGLALLHKPLRPAKLRALLARLLPRGA